ncbi:MAG TPA: hypothetical protein VF931_12290, partial [Steroidobacteraceae bacterium]
AVADGVPSLSSCRPHRRRTIEPLHQTNFSVIFNVLINEIFSRPRPVSNRRLTAWERVAHGASIIGRCCGIGPERNHLLRDQARAADRRVGN